MNEAGVRNSRTLCQLVQIFKVGKTRVGDMRARIVRSIFYPDHLNAVHWFLRLQGLHLLRPG